ncbi:hypothetical protein FGIG_00803 [Fasciola gigantica]|uniref:Small ribosomal subunit protein mS23 conserved domain-containing protein n=1 Tax=Fasciola gigantica TaxID=46835 RepID=A0A504YHT4_FASGI|nr:hypothetical protein FGIG_00803 [Fasciola gigantica]
MQNGVIPYEQRPVWYDVYKAFPPKVEPVHSRPLPEKVIRPILYPEDEERAEAFRRYKRLSLINAFKLEDDRSSLSRLLKQYKKVKAAHPDLKIDELFTLAERELQKEGIILTPNE